MMKMLIVLILTTLAASALQTPSDLLVYDEEPTKTVALTGLSPTSAWSIAETNEPLKPWKPINIDDLGHYFSDSVRDIKQGDDEVIIKTLINFTETGTPIPISINESEDDLLYL